MHMRRPALRTSTWTLLFLVSCATAVDDPEGNIGGVGVGGSSSGGTTSTGGTTTSSGGTTTTVGGTTSTTGGTTSTTGGNGGVFGVGGSATGGEGTGGEGTGGEATGGNGSGGTVYEGDCADKPTWMQGGSYETGAQALFTCTIQHGQGECSGLEIGVVHLFECIATHAPNCGQSPEGGEAWAYVTTCEE